MLDVDTVSFDCYGTLIDWESGLRDAIQRILERKHIRMDADRVISKWLEMDYILVQQAYRSYKQIMKGSLRYAMESNGIDYSESDGDLLVESLAFWRPFDDVRPALEGIKGKYRLIIISNIDNDLIAKSLELIGVGFDGVVTAEDVKAYKPSKRVFEYAIEKFGLVKHRTLHASFSPRYDLLTAKSVGFRTAWIYRKQIADNTHVECDLKFKNLLELKDALLGGAPHG